MNPTQDTRNTRNTRHDQWPVAPGEHKQGPGAVFADAVVEDSAHVGYQSARGAQGSLVLGDNAHLRSGTIVYAASTIGAAFTTGHNVVVREECEIGDRVSVWSNTVIDYGCQIGNDVKIHSNCYVAQFTVIEDGAFLAPGVSIANDLYPGDAASAQAMAGPHIGAGAQIGAGSTLLPYVKIGAGALIGAGSVVTKDISAGMVAVGNPARCTKRVSELTPIHMRTEEART